MKRVLVTTFSILFYVIVFSQETRIRHATNYKSIVGGAGFYKANEKESKRYFLGYNHYLNTLNMIEATINYEEKYIGNTLGKYSYLDASFGRTLIKSNNNFYLNFKLGGTIGNENLYSELTDQENINRFIWGFVFSLSDEIFIGSKICLEPFITQYYRYRSNMGETSFNYGLAIKLKI